MTDTTGALGVEILSFPTHLQAAGTSGRPFVAVCVVDEVPVGSMLRITSGDLDLLIAHTDRGLVATADRCPHMSAPLSVGFLDGCILDCPLHRGRFDLETGDTVGFPTTGGLDADGGHHPPWSPSDAPPKPEPSDVKAQARALTRTRRLRYYPLRVVGDTIEVALPE